MVIQKVSHRHRIWEIVLGYVLHFSNRFMNMDYNSEIVLRAWVAFGKLSYEHRLHLENCLTSMDCISEMADGWLVAGEADVDCERSKPDTCQESIQQQFN